MRQQQEHVLRSGLRAWTEQLLLITKAVHESAVRNCVQKKQGADGERRSGALAEPAFIMVRFPSTPWPSIGKYQAGLQGQFENG